MVPGGVPGGQSGIPWVGDRVPWVKDTSRGWGTGVGHDPIPVGLTVSVVDATPHTRRVTVSHGGSHRRGWGEGADVLPGCHPPVTPRPPSSG